MFRHAACRTRLHLDGDARAAARLAAIGLLGGGGDVVETQRTLLVDRRLPDLADHQGVPIPAVARSLADEGGLAVGDVDPPVC